MNNFEDDKLMSMVNELDCLIMFVLAESYRVMRQFDHQSIIIDNWTDLTYTICNQEDINNINNKLFNIVVNCERNLSKNILVKYNYFDSVQHMQGQPSKL